MHARMHTQRHTHKKNNLQLKGGVEDRLQRLAYDLGLLQLVTEHDAWLQTDRDVGVTQAWPVQSRQVTATDHWTQGKTPPTLYPFFFFFLFCVSCLSKLSFPFTFIWSEHPGIQVSDDFIHWLGFIVAWLAIIQGKWKQPPRSPPAPQSCSIA